MPKGTRVEKVYKALLREGHSKASAAKIAGQSLKTGRKYVPKFSFIFPARGHQDKLKRTLDSIVRTTSRLQDVEVLIAVDSDDNELKNVGYNGGLDVTFFEYPPRKDILCCYYNALAKKAKGDVIWVWSQECFLRTMNWDKIARKHIKRHPKWDVWLAMPRDITLLEEMPDGRWKTKIQGNPITKEEFSCYYMLSRKAYEALGFVQKPELRMWGSDLYMCMLFANPLVNRRIEMREIEVVSEDPNPTMASGGTNKLEVYQEDLKIMESKGLCTIKDGIVAYNVESELKRLKKHILLPRMWRLDMLNEGS